MMRDILFRGKCVDTGIWYEGGYIHLHKTTHCPIGDPEQFPDNDIHQIVFERMTDWELPNQHLRVDVNPETVGQFTGLTDKNGKKIFEGDVIQFHKFRDEPDWVGVISYDQCQYIVTGKMPLSYGKPIDGEAFYCPFEVAVSGINKETIKVIGNIHDNQELLEERQ
jgi:uncharacterized phage protein (TIGR01671 family)